VARALDVIGDRWTLLIVRELQARPCRYGDLLAGLPGIATNLLADRLRSLEAAGLVTQNDGEAVYRLTERGEGLRGVIKELMRWGAPLMTTGQGDDVFRPQWLPLALEAVYETAAIDPPVALGVRTDEGSVEMWIGVAGVRSRLGETDGTEVALDGPVGPILGVLTGLLSREDGSSMGVRISGSESELTRLLGHLKSSPVSTA
jgi:DNA-binding HxlR family transcriptional regulator